jgi:xylulokinase
MGVTQGAGLSLQWFRNQLAPDAVRTAEERGIDTYHVLTEEAAAAPAGCEGLFWLPYLMGERTPHLDATARGGWIGMTAKHTRAHLIRSVIEGVTYSLNDCLSIIAELGVNVTAVRASGGGARSPFWREILAGVFNCPIATLETQEGSAYGVALLAMVGTKQFASVGEACKTCIHEKDRVEPKADDADVYRERYEIFRSLYPALKPSFGAIAGAA